MTTPMPPPDFGLFTALRYDPQLLQSSENTSLSGNNLPTPLYNFVYHYERLIKALDHFGWRPKSKTAAGLKGEKNAGSHPSSIDPVANIETFREAVSTAAKEFLGLQERENAGWAEMSLKLRPVLSREGTLTIEVSQTPATSITNLFPSNPLPAPPSMEPPLFKPEFTLTVDPGPITPSSHTEYKTTPRPQYDLSRSRAKLHSESEPREVILWNPQGKVMEGSRTNLYFYRGGRWVTPSEETGCLKGTERRWLLEKGMVEVEDILVEDVKDGDVVLLSNGVRGIWAGTVRRAT